MKFGFKIEDSRFVDSPMEKKKMDNLDDYFNNFGRISSLNDDSAMLLLMEMMAKGEVKLFSEYCAEKNIEAGKDENDNCGNFVASLDKLVGQAIEIAKSENKNLEDFRIKIFEILFARENSRENLKVFCAGDEKLKEKFEELTAKELKN